MSTVELSFVSVAEGKKDNIALLELNRPETSNAFNEETGEEIKKHLKTVAANQNCRMLVLRGRGKHFSAGADLEWMKKSADLNEKDNLTAAHALSEMFLDLYQCPVPTMAVVQGAAFGGGVGIVAACDWAIADETAKFCLSEVKVGIVSAVILPYLTLKMSTGTLNRFVHGARVFDAAEAEKSGLVQRTYHSKDLDAVLKDEIRQVLTGSPVAQKTFKKIHQKMREKNTTEWAEHRKEMEATIARMRASQSGKEGIRSFLEKRKPEWFLELKEEIKF